MIRSEKEFQIPASKNMSTTKPAPRARPLTSVPPNSPRTEENQGYRRGRAIRSCLECRRRKMRCNRSRPCQNCNRFCRNCVYLPFPEWPSGTPVTSKGQGNSQSPEQRGGRSLASIDSSHRGSLVPTSPFGHRDHGFDTDPPTRHNNTLCEIDADDEHVDVGLQIGKLSITENLNYFFRPHVASQVSIAHSFLRQSILLRYQMRSQRTPSVALRLVSADCCTSRSDRSDRTPIPPPKCLWHTCNPASSSIRVYAYFGFGQTDPTSRAFTRLSDIGLAVFSTSARSRAPCS